RLEGTQDPATRVDAARTDGQQRLRRETGRRAEAGELALTRRPEGPQLALRPVRVDPIERPLSRRTVPFQLLGDTADQINLDPQRPQAARQRIELPGDRPQVRLDIDGDDAGTIRHQVTPLDVCRSAANSGDPGRVTGRSTAPEPAGGSVSTIGADRSTGTGATPWTSAQIAAWSSSSNETNSPHEQPARTMMRARTPGSGSPRPQKGPAHPPPGRCPPTRSPAATSRTRGSRPHGRTASATRASAPSRRNRHRPPGPWPGR